MCFVVLLLPLDCLDCYCFVWADCGFGWVTWVWVGVVVGLLPAVFGLLLLCGGLGGCWFVCWVGCLGASCTDSCRVYIVFCGV